MLRRHVALVLALALVPVLAVTGCRGGEEERESSVVPGRTLTVYASVPRRGDSTRQADAVAAGARLALADAGRRAGGYRVRLVELDSSDPEADGSDSDAGGWDPATVAANAERAVEDPTTIAYIGELDFGGSAVSLPITNDAGILQVSPGDGLTDLTRRQPGESGTGPERYYPRGTRTFLRLVPTDFLRASAIVDAARDSGARSVAILHDQGLFGRDLTAQIGAIAECDGLTVTAADGVGGDPDGYQELSERVAKERPDAVVYAGGAGERATSLFAALDRALPGASFFASGAVANDPALGAGADGEVLLVSPARPPPAYPREARGVLRRIAARREDPVPTDALYGYEAMRLILDAVKRAGAAGGDRLTVARRALAPRERRSLLGTYGVDSLGDTSEWRFAGYRRQRGRLRFAGVRRPRHELAVTPAALERVPPVCELILHGADGRD